MRHYSYHLQIAVLGGGPAGLSAALAAARSGKQVMLLEKTGDGDTSSLQKKQGSGARL